MMGDAVVGVYTRTETRDSEGIVVPAYALAESPIVNLQPLRLSEARAKEYGLSTALSAALLCVRMGAPGSIIVGGRVNAALGLYDIRGVSAWPDHIEAVLIPVQGGQP